MSIKMQKRDYECKGKVIGEHNLLKWQAKIYNNSNPCAYTPRRCKNEWRRSAHIPNFLNFFATYNMYFHVLAIEPSNNRPGYFNRIVFSQIHSKP